jgi:hypothetical protein
MLLWIAVLAAIAYAFIRSCLGERRNQAQGNGGTTPPRPWPWGGGGFSGFGSGDNQDAPPPPYTHKPDPNSATQGPGWRPGFWTGAALGGIGATMLNRNRNPSPRAQRQAYDWEQRRGGAFDRSFRSRPSSYEDRQEGSSNLGAMRSSTGLGGSSVR